MRDTRVREMKERDTRETRGRDGTCIRSGFPAASIPCWRPDGSIGGNFKSPDAVPGETSLLMRERERRKEERREQRKAGERL